MPTYRETAAPPALARWIECSWSLQVPDGVCGYRVPPDGCIDVIFDPRAGLRAVGAMTVEQRFDFAPGASIAGVRFRPGLAAAFVPVSPMELTDGAAEFSSPLVDQMMNAASPAHAIGLLVSGLHLRTKVPNPVQRAIEAMTRANGNIDTDYCARHANLSPRQFRRRCHEESGLSPKLLARILRFRYACQLAQAARRRPNWSMVAAEAAYFDQAHLIRDFRLFTTETPMAVFSKTADAQRE